MSTPLTQKHYGFCIVPRLIMRSTRFAKLPESAKWLYACLKDICGEAEKGECFYSLRNLEGLIHMSISTLSRSIHKLADAGLILAEKVGAKGREIFHIKIVNIWKENDDAYKDCFKTTQLDSTVSNRNTSESPTVSAHDFTVSNRNSTVSESHNLGDNQAQDCFNLTDKEEGFKKIFPEEDMEEEKSSPSPSSDISLNSQETGIIPTKEIVPIPNTELSRTDQLRQWVSDFGVEVSQRDLAKVEQQYQGIASEIQTREDFQSLHTIALEKVKRIPNNDGKVKLGNLVSALKEWRIAQAPTNVAEPIEDDCCNAQYAPSERDTTALIAAIEQYNPALKVAVKQTDFGVSVSIKRDDQEHRNIPVFSLDDWYNNVLKKDLGLLGQAVKYGQSLKRSA